MQTKLLNVEKADGLTQMRDAIRYREYTTNKVRRSFPSSESIEVIGGPVWIEKGPDVSPCPMGGCKTGRWGSYWTELDECIAQDRTAEPEWGITEAGG